MLLCAIHVCFADGAPGLTNAELNKIDSCLIAIKLQTNAIDLGKRKIVVDNIATIRKSIFPQKWVENKRLFDSLRLTNLCKKIKNENLFKDQFPILARAASNSHYEMIQIASLIQLFEFPQEKRQAARILIPKSVDLENIDLLYDQLWTTDDKKFISDLADSISFH